MRLNYPLVDYLNVKYIYAQERRENKFLMKRGIKLSFTSAKNISNFHKLMRNFLLSHKKISIVIIFSHIYLFNFKIFHEASLITKKMMWCDAKWLKIFILMFSRNQKIVFTWGNFLSFFIAAADDDDGKILINMRLWRASEWEKKV